MPTSRLCRRVVLEVVPRRDAGQRLNLALCLLLRDQFDRSPPPVSHDDSTRSGPTSSQPTKEECSP